MILSSAPVRAPVKTALLARGDYFRIKLGTSDAILEKGVPRDHLSGEPH